MLACALPAPLGGASSSVEPYSPVVAPCGITPAPEAQNEDRAQSGSSASSAETQQAVPPAGQSNAAQHHALPRGTTVLIKGNQRTAPRLIGLEGTVKRSIGLGGWSLIELDGTGEEVKLQRNALQVLEWGTLTDEQESDVEQSPVQETPEIITRPRIRRPPRSLSPVPEIRKKASYGVRTASPPFQMAPSVDLQKLHSTSLQRYNEVYNLVDAPHAEDDVLFAVTEHFRAQSVYEDDVLVAFARAVRRRRLSEP